MPGFTPKAIVIEGRGHMMGRLASIAQWGSALVVRGQIFEHSSNYFTIWKITKMLISQPNLNGFAFCKKTPKCLSFASVFKHSPHF